MARFISLAGALLVTLALTLGIAPSASAAAQPVRIIKVQYDSPGTDTRTNASINAEYVIIKNFSTTTRTLTNWTLRDKQGHIYKFPTFRLAAGKTVVVRSGKGTATQITRYFNSGNYIWNNTGDAAILRTNTGASVSTCAWATIAPGYKNCP